MSISGRTVVGITIVFLGISRTLLAREPESDVARIVRAATEALRSDGEWMRQSGGRGHIDWTSSDGQTFFACEMSCVRRDQRMWFELTTTASSIIIHRPKDITRVIADGTTLISARFSQFIHPAGCEAWTLNDGPSDYKLATHGCAFDPRLLFPPSLWPLNAEDPMAALAAQAGEMRVESKSGSTTTVLLKYGPSGRDHIRMQFDSDLAYRPVRVELIDSERDLAYHIQEFKWEDKDGRLCPGEILIKEYDWQKQGAYGTTRILIDQLAPAVTKDERYTIAALHLCADARMIDHRPNAKVRVRNVTSAEPDANAEISTEVKALPVTTQTVVRKQKSGFVRKQIPGIFKMPGVCQPAATGLSKASGWRALLSLPRPRRPDGVGATLLVRPAPPSEVPISR